KIVANFRQVRAASDQFRADVKRSGPGGGILERASIRGDRGEEAVRNLLGDGPFGDLQYAKNQFAAGRLARRDPVEVAVTRVAGVMIDVDELLAVGHAGADRAEPLEARAIRGDDAVEFLAAFGFLKKAVGIEKGQ